MQEHKAKKTPRPMSAYVFFTMEKRMELFEMNPNIPQKDIIRVIAQLWKETSSEDREKYKKLAEEDKARYEAAQENDLQDETKHRTKNEPTPPHDFQNEFSGSNDENEIFQSVIRSNEFISANTFRSQISILSKNFLRSTGMVPFSKIAHAFGRSRQSIRNQYLKSLKPHHPNGRPPSLSTSELNSVAEYINKMHTNSSYAYYPSFSELSDYIYINFGKTLSPDTLRHLFYEYLSKDFKTCIGTALDKDRYESQLSDIEENLKVLKMKVDGLPSNFVFNCDEVGHSEFADSPQKILIVPKSYTAKVAPYPSNKNGKHATCIACISPVGISCKPLFTVPRSTVDPELYTSLPLDSLDIVHTES